MLHLKLPFFHHPLFFGVPTHMRKKPTFGPFHYCTCGTCNRAAQELITLTSGSITPLYHGKKAAATIVHAIAAPYCASEGATIIDSPFFALALDSCTDRGAGREELLYTRTIRNGVVKTQFMACKHLKTRDAGAIVAAYKRALLWAGVSVDQWVARLF